MTAVKVGDRVRLTCGESVIVGVCHKGTSYSPSLWVTPDGTDVTFIYDTRWNVEVLPPLIPDNRGTVVIDRYDSAWQRWASGWQAIGGDKFDMRTLPQLMVGFGPLTVLWTPEATP